eukprot:m.40005 g.40005  ORF g.40005 m.40005 type:complete len:139 (-) comp11679_c0_seq2:68-484(-)
MPLTKEIADIKTRQFLDRYNANDIDTAVTVYAKDCTMEIIGEETVKLDSRDELAEHLRELRNERGGTNFRGTVEYVKGNTDHFKWRCDIGEGECDREWKEVGHDWVIFRKVSTFKPLKEPPSETPFEHELTSGQPLQT